jgi:hypothetical protein
MAMKVTAALAALVVVAVAVAACGGDDEGKGNGSLPVAADLDPSFFSPEITNRYFPFASVPHSVLVGREKVDGKRVEIREEATVGNQAINISGALTTAVEVLSYTDGKLDERTKDYFAQGKDGWVYYFGEDVDEFEGGKTKHTGSWKVGWNEEQPQRFVPPAAVKLGQRFSQESVAGVAVEEVEIVGVNEAVKAPAGRFDRCIQWHERDPLAKQTAEKWHCADVGFVKETFEDGYLELTEFDRR